MKYVSDEIVFPELHRDGSGYRIPIPAYHRASVGVFQETRLFAIALPRNRDLIISPIDPTRWGDLWRLEAEVKDVPGAARSIVETLYKRNVNILVQEGLSDEVGDPPHTPAHRLFMILDLEGYESDLDGRSVDRNSVKLPALRPNQLITEILADAQPYLLSTPARDRWKFEFERMEFFFRNKEDRTRSHETRLSNKSIVLSEHLVRNEVFAGAEFPQRLACHLISDTEEKYIKIRFLLPDRKYILIRIEHREEVGAIYGFMDVLKDHAVNIINSYNRLTSISERAVWYALCELPREIFVKQWLAELLTALDELELVNLLALQSEYNLGFDARQQLGTLELKHLDQTRPLSPDELGSLPPSKNGSDLEAAATFGRGGSPNDPEDDDDEVLGTG